MARAASVRTQAPGPRVVVVGAGAFGGWTAHELARRGARVTLIDAWGPGNARASSGGETRVIRATYGTRSLYTKMARRALELWQQYDERWQRRFFHKTGAMWLFGDGSSGAAAAFGRASADALRAEGLPVEALTPVEARRRFPQVAFDHVSSVLIEREAGYLLARRACEHVVDRAIAEGAEYRQASAAAPVRIDGSSLQGLRLTDGMMLRADAFVFACGPWLGSIFPDVVGTLVTPTRQEVYYFGTPAGDARFLEAQLPVWIDYGQRLVYGIPGNANRGFKVADDTAGPRFDPTNGQREATDAGVKRARAFIAGRFPALADAPLVGAEVCQYEASPDSNYLIDRHPGASNVWIVGGGSGHGFKMGPAMGELVASLVLGESQPDPFFGLARFAGTRRRPGKHGEEKWL
jgi:glycine/D-amino acid oxidase-like deaminating enzyme